MIRIPIIFGWLVFHSKEQLCLCKKPILVCHYNVAGWMQKYFDIHSKRLFCIGRDKEIKGRLDFHDPWFSRE